MTPSTTAVPTPTARAARTGLRAFAQRHDQLLTVIGALIVFFGFYYKEVRLDRLNDFNTALAAAQSKLHLDGKMQEISNKIDALDSQLSDLQTNGINNSIYHDEYNVISQQSHTFGADQDRLSFAAQVLPNLPVRRPDLSDQAGNLQKEVPAISALESETLSKLGIAKLAAAGKNSQLDKTPQYKAVIDAASRFVPRVTDFDGRVSHLQEAVETEIRDQLENVNRRSDHATHISDGLFILGWFLGLAGKILRIPALSE